MYCSYCIILVFSERKPQTEEREITLFRAIDLHRRSMSTITLLTYSMCAYNDSHVTEVVMCTLIAFVVVFMPAVSLYRVRLMSCLVAELALAVDVVAAVADGAVHAYLLARVVLALGGAHHRG